MRPGKKLGEYRLLRRVGIGGMGEVFEAEIKGTAGYGKRLAIKVLLPQYQRDSQVVDSFIDEATISSQLSHPNIIPVYDFGQIDSFYYIAMEFQDGWDLREVLARCRTARYPLPIGAVALIGHEVAAALHHIHSNKRSIVHRDVTPHNVFVGRKGHVKLGDFGIAKAAARRAHTEHGQIKGKLAYLSPEQASGNPVTSRTDIYAVGLVLFEMLTGELYNDGATEAELLDRALNPARRRPSASRADATPLDDIVEAALQRHPAMRTRDAALLCDKLAACLMQHPFDSHAMAELVCSLPDSEPSADLLGTASAEFFSSNIKTIPSDSGQPTRTPTSTKAIKGKLADHDHRVLYAALGVLVVGLLIGYFGLNLSDEKSVALPADAGTVADLPQQVPHIAETIDSAVAPSADVEVKRVDATVVSLKRPLPRRTSRRLRGSKKRSHSRRPVLPSARVNRKQIKRQLARLTAYARSRGLFRGDLPDYDAHRSKALRTLAAGEYKAAASHLEAMEATIKAFRIDRRFVKRKMARLERAITAADAADRGPLNVQAQRILRLVLSEKFVSASKRISELLGRLR